MAERTSAADAISDLLAAMDKSNGGQANGSSYDTEALKSVLQSRELQNLLEAHDQLEKARRKAGDSEPNEGSAKRLGTECFTELVITPEEPSAESKELAAIIDSPHVRALLDSYDGVLRERKSAKQTASLNSPVAPLSAPNAAQPAPIPLKLIGLNKPTNEPLGLVLKQEDGEVKISRIMVGMGADRQGLLHVGDTIKEINNQDVRGSVELVQEEIARATGTITMKVVPTYFDQLPTSQVYVKALFSYNPNDDAEHPFRPGGLSFQRGDILQILSQDDQSWWQAKVEGRDDRAGLIPGLLLEERRQALARDPGSPPARRSCLGLQRKEKPKPVMYSYKRNAEFDRHELNIYEEVARLGPGQRKAVVLIGAQGVGRRGLKHRIILKCPDRYATTLPHTSRPPKGGEEDGKHYWFVSEEAMSADIAAHKYIEHGTYTGHLYGTKVDSIRAVVRSGKVCLLDVNPQALKILKTAEFKPYVVFINAPTFDVLKRMHQDAARIGGQDAASAYTDEDLQRTLQESEHIERAYQHFFDMTIINEGIEETFEKLMDVLNKLEKEPQWVPVSWVY